MERLHRDGLIAQFNLLEQDRIVSTNLVLAVPTTSAAMDHAQQRTQT